MDNFASSILCAAHPDMLIWNSVRLIATLRPTRVVPDRLESNFCATHGYVDYPQKLPTTTLVLKRWGWFIDSHSTKYSSAITMNSFHYLATLFCIPTRADMKSSDHTWTRHIRAWLLPYLPRYLARPRVR